MNDFISLAHDSIELRTKLINQIQENLELKKRLLAETEDSVKIINEKQVILGKFIKKSEEMIKILEILQISLEAMKKVRENMPIDDPNREILNNAFLQISEKQMKLEK